MTIKKYSHPHVRLTSYRSGTKAYGVEALEACLKYIPQGFLQLVGWLSDLDATWVTA